MKINGNKFIAIVEIIAAGIIVSSYVINGIFPLLSPDYHVPDYARGGDLAMFIGGAVFYIPILILFAIAAWLNGIYSNRKKVIMILELVIVISGILSFHPDYNSPLSILAVPFLLIPKALIYVMLILLASHSILISALRQKIKKVLIPIATVAIIGISLMTGYQLSIPKESIPSDIPQDVRVLIEQLYSSDSSVRSAAVSALGELGTRSTPAIPFLIELLGDTGTVSRQSTDEIHYKAIEALIKIDKLSVEPFIAALEHKNPYVRRGAATILGSIGDTRAVAPLIAMVKDKDPMVRRYAVENLGDIKDTRAVELLISMLSDEDDGMRVDAIKALCKIQDPRRVTAIITVLEKDGDWYVRGGAAEALGEIKDQRAIRPLINALNDKDRGVRYHAADALKKITVKDFGEDYVKWKEWYEQNK